MDKQIFEIVTKSGYVVASALLESRQQAWRFFDEYLEDNVHSKYRENFILDTKNKG